MRWRFWRRSPQRLPVPHIVGLRESQAREALRRTEMRVVATERLTHTVELLAEDVRRALGGRP